MSLITNLLITVLTIICSIFIVLWYIYYLKYANYKRDKERSLLLRENEIIIKEKELARKEDCCNALAIHKKVLDNISINLESLV